MSFVSLCLGEESKFRHLRPYLEKNGVSQQLYLVNQTLNESVFNYIRNILKDVRIEGVFVFEQSEIRCYPLKFIAEHSFAPVNIVVDYQTQGPFVECHSNFVVESFSKESFDGYAPTGVTFFARSFFETKFLDFEEMLSQKALYCFPISGVDLDKQGQEDPCLFLDRDGIIIEDVEYPHREEDIHFREDIVPLIEYANKNRIRVIVLTNQAGIGRGIFDYDQYHKFTNLLQQEFKKRGVFWDAIYECPYHEKYGQNEYLQNSLLRKPMPGMLLKALRDFNIDLGRSLMIGDKDSDIFHFLGLKTFLMKVSYSIKSTSQLIFSFEDALDKLKEIVES